MKLFSILAVLSLLLALFSLGASAQIAPSTLPSFTVQLSAGYSSTQGSLGSSGDFASIAVPIYSPKSNSYLLSIRGDYFSVTQPNTYVLTGGPEFRYQFSKASFLNGTVLQPFINSGIGGARSACVSTMNCPAGADISTHFAAKVGGGLDIITTQHVVARLLEVDYIHSTIFPTGHVLMSNFAQISAGIGLRF